ncbi:uncharacterized protein F5147DRAFT_38273 [Suillus discolor]|uniref:Uncharacterized protein n=1 Tax=Suillus discolor TaxID=1912936 RepID=A0A9P7JXT8_9AGAM|nr:uncharacterized protein F5147DRAFT_38273 [Suillus discolor]KAG2113939.1 hypothetical protein F5147DRAFT_38273 [Suillus discolor]
MLAIFFEFYCLLQAKNRPMEYLNRKRHELLSGHATQGTQFGRGGHSARARRHGVNDGRDRSSGPGRGAGRGRGRGRSRGAGRGRGCGRGRSSGQEGPSPAPSTVTKALQEHSRTSEAPESNKVPDVRKIVQILHLHRPFVNYQGKYTQDCPVARWAMLTALLLLMQDKRPTIQRFRSLRSAILRIDGCKCTSAI